MVLVSVHALPQQWPHRSRVQQDGMQRATPLPALSARLALSVQTPTLLLCRFHIFDRNVGEQGVDGWGGWAGGRRGSWIAKGGKEALGEMVGGVGERGGASKVILCPQMGNGIKSSWKNKLGRRL